MRALLSFNISKQEQTNANRTLAKAIQNFRATAKSQTVFGNKLENLPLYSGCSDSSACFYNKEKDIPDFLVKSVEKIETMLSTVGIYRINGDAVLVAKLR